MAVEKLLNRAWWSNMLLFLLHGLVVGTWVSRIPAVQVNLHLSNPVLGVTLLSSAVGALLTIRQAGRFVTRFGSHVVSTWSTFAFCASLILPGIAFTAPLLASALFLYGASAAAMDVAMNAQGVEIEKRLGHPTMSRFHAMFSIGAMAGAALGGMAASRGLSPALHFSLSAAAFGVLTAAAVPFLIPEATLSVAAPTSESTAAHGHWKSIPPVLLALTGIGFCMLLSEGAVADWTGVYLRQTLHAGPGQAAAGYAVFSASMAVFRLLGDVITARLGASATLRAGAAVGAVGLLWALSAATPSAVLPGLAAVGAGFSVIIPLVFGSGGRVEGISPGDGIATVTGIGYFGFIVGPPLIGFLSQAITLRYALGLLLVCCAVTFILARAVPPLMVAGQQG